MCVGNVQFTGAANTELRRKLHKFAVVFAGPFRRHVPLCDAKLSPFVVVVCLFVCLFLILFLFWSRENVSLCNDQI